MKKVEIILLLLGVISIVIGGFCFLFLELPRRMKASLLDSIENNLSYYKIDNNSFSSMNFLLEDNKFIVQIRKKNFVLNDGTYDGSYNSLKYPVEILSNKIVSTKGEFSISYKDNVFTFESEEERIKKAFGGDYSLSDSDYSIPKTISDNYFGIYQKNSDNHNIIYVSSKNDNYIISGFVVRDIDSVEFKEKVVLENDSTTIQNNNIILSFHDGQITLLSKNMGKDLSFVNGEYQKISKLPRETILLELDKYISLLPGVYGEML